jgi:dihydroorotate dehydrogenase electron transfer subunit
MSKTDDQSTQRDGADGARGVFLARVAENRAVCQDHFTIYLDIDNFPASAPGQFVNIGPVIGHTGEPFQPARPLLKRPFSILSREDRPGGATRIGVLYRVLGFGTGWIGTLRSGDTAQVIGPLGRGFRIPDGIRTALMIAGGTGIAPLIYLSKILKVSHPHVRIVMFEGVRTKDLLPFRTDLAAPCPDPKVLSSEIADIPVLIASDDGTIGQAGTVIDTAQRWVAANVKDPAGTFVFSCGPEPMMAALAAVCERHQLRCQVSLEKSMACGMGTCQSCVVKVKDAADADGWVYKLCCKDGPPFDAGQVVWK